MAEHDTSSPNALNSCVNTLRIIQRYLKRRHGRRPLGVDAVLEGPDVSEAGASAADANLLAGQQPPRQLRM